MTKTNQEPGDTGRENTPERSNNGIVMPHMTFAGQPLMFIAIDASAMMQGGVPLEICWTPDATTRPTSRIIKPPMDWQDRPRDDHESAIHGLTVGIAIKRGEPLQVVAKEAYAAFHNHRLVSVFPGHDRVLLTELFLQTPVNPGFRYLSLSDLALKIAARVSLDNDSFARAAIHHWFKVFKPQPAAQRVRHMAALIYAIVEASVAKGLIDPGQPFEIDG